MHLLAPEPTESLLHVDVAYDGDVAHLSLTGRFDVASAYVVDGELRRALDHGSTRVVVDVADADALDASAVRMLLDGADVARARGACVNVRGAAAAQLMLIEALGVQQLLGLV